MLATEDRQSSYLTVYRRPAPCLWYVECGGEDDCENSIRFYVEVSLKTMGEPSQAVETLCLPTNAETIEQGRFLKPVTGLNNKPHDKDCHVILLELPHGTGQ